MPKTHKPTRRLRLSANESRLRLIAATLEVLMEHGAAGASTRRIAAHAGVSIGLINHHFVSLGDLFGAAYFSLATSLHQDIKTKWQTSKGPGRARLSALVQETFAPHCMNRRSLRAWATFWGLVEVSPPVQAAHIRCHGNVRALLEEALDSVAEDGRLNMTSSQAALGLSALIDGLWLNWCLQPANFHPAQGIALCEAWIDHVCLDRAQAPS